jgi:pyridoxine kinase
VVLVTSAVVKDTADDEIVMIALSGAGAWQVTTPKLDRAFTGSGDVTTAVFLAHYLASGSVPDALGKTADIVYSLLERTTAIGQQELALVAAQDELVNPSHHFEVVALG